MTLKKPRKYKPKSFIYNNNKLISITFRHQYYCTTLKPGTNNIGNQEKSGTLRKNVIKYINPFHHLDFITVYRKNNVHLQSIPDQKPSARSTTLEHFNLKLCHVPLHTKALILQQQSHLFHRQAYREHNIRHIPSQFFATSLGTILTPLVKHINPFGCFSDKENTEAPSVESALDSTTNDKFSGMNGDASYVSTNLDLQQQFLGLAPPCCTSLGPLSGTSLESVSI